MTSGPGIPSEGGQATWRSFGILLGASLHLIVPPNPKNCLGPDPELCLSVNRTHPYERDPMYFASSTNRI